MCEYINKCRKDNYHGLIRQDKFKQLSCIGVYWLEETGDRIRQDKLKQISCIGAKMDGKLTRISGLLRQVASYYC